MGCWNKTCGLSNLPIFAHDDVYVFVLEKNSIESERCYSTAFWRPVLLPFYSVYDDYGGGEQSNGPGFPILISCLKNCIANIEQGENQYHDIPVNRENFDEKMFFDSIRENRLFILDPYREKQIPIDYVMFRKDIVDFILETNVIELYVGDGKGNTGWRNNYINVKFDDIIADIDKYLDRIFSEFKKLKETLPNVEMAEFFLQNKFKEWRGENSTLFDKFVMTDNHRNSAIFDFSCFFSEEIAKAEINRENIKSFLIEYMKGCYLDRFMSATRRNWMPGGHEGSQSCINPEYTTLINSIQHVMCNIKKEFDDVEE